MRELWGAVFRNRYKRITRFCPFAPCETKDGIELPVKSENKALYPPEWKRIRAQILERAGNCCERCGVANHAMGARTRHGEWMDADRIGHMNSDDGYWAFGEYPKIIKIVLTIAHLEHNPKRNLGEDIQALCQRCHNRHDIKHRVETRRKNRQQAIGPAIPGLFEVAQ